MSGGSVAVQLQYGLNVVGHLSKLAFHFMFIFVRLVVVVSSVRLACNVSTHAYRRLRWLCGLGVAAVGVECIVSGILSIHKHLV